MKKAIIVGINGQDGTYLSELLLAQGYEIIGVTRETIDIRKSEQVNQLLLSHQPQEVYFLAAFHHSSEEVLRDDSEVFRKSFEIHTIALINFLEGIKKYTPKTRLFYAASSHIFGNCTLPMQDELTMLDPNCIYGITKASAVHACRYYRDNHRVFASVGILYNHESPRRSSRFVSKKIVEAAVAIKENRQDILVLGNLDTKIDWGYAPDYVEAIYRILQLEQPQDFIVSSGKQHTVRDFVAGVFDELGLDWNKYVKEDPSLIQKTRKGNLYGNNQKLKTMTGWAPQVSFEKLIKIMIKEGIKADVSR